MERSGYRAATHKMHDDRNYCKDQQQMNKAACDMENCKPKQPQHEKNGKYGQKHDLSPSFTSAIGVFLPPLY